MAWTAPRTWLVGEVATPAMLNVHLRDNLLAIGKRMGCRAYRFNNLSIASGVWTAVPFDGGEAYDTDGFHDNVTNPSRFTIPTGGGGYYMFTAAGEFAPVATNSYGLKFQVTDSLGNAAAFGEEMIWPVQSGTNDTYVQTHGIAKLVAGEYVELMAWQNTGVARNFEYLDTDCPTMACARLGV
jgi:hypothetical protein